VEAAGRQVRLGHTRLAILDRSDAGRQPMASRDGRWWVTFNGEIYDHLDLRRDLSGPFRGRSDTETLVEALAAWGVERTLSRLGGMFAFGALDLANARLVLARDPFGIKPLYYGRVGGGAFAFASEAHVLRRAGAACTVSQEALQTFLTLRYVPSPDTLWSEIRRLAPGDVLTLDLATETAAVRCFVQATSERYRGSLADAARDWREVLGGAVRRQMLSDVPVGVLLSGGVDSAVVAALAREANPSLPTFSVGFEGGHSECELEAAAASARALGLPNVAVRPSCEDLWASLEEVVRAVEEPLGTTSILPMWHLVRRARRDVTVVLTGQGNDEPWGGYRRHQLELVRGGLPGLVSRAAGAIGRRGAALPEAIERGLRSVGVTGRAERFAETCALFTAPERLALLGTDARGGALPSIERWLSWAGPGDDAILRVDCRMGLADDLLLYGDKVAMAFGLEARVPMLDREAVRFVESLPLAYRVRLGRTKIAHRRMARALLPPAVVDRPKQGFQVPFGAWIRGPWRERVGACLLDPGAPYLGCIDPAAVRGLWREHQEGRRDRSRALFALLTLATWWRTSGAPPSAETRC
jgi:asparagine synthase (glutamine-hydrolysing)